MDCVINTGQKTINYITDQARKNVSCDSVKYISDLLAATDIKEFLSRKKEPLIQCIYIPLINSGVENLKQLINEANFPRNDNFSNRARHVLTAFPNSWIECININEGNDRIDIRDNFPLIKNKPTNLSQITVKM